MAHFEGKAYEITTIPGKPILIDFKIWVIAQSGYFLQWVSHTKRKSGGLVRVRIPPELRGSRIGKGQAGNKTAAVIPYLLNLLPDPPFGRSTVYLDNLFVSDTLLMYLRSLR